MTEPQRPAAEAHEPQFPLYNPYPNAGGPSDGPAPELVRQPAAPPPFQPAPNRGIPRRTLIGIGVAAAAATAGIVTVSTVGGLGRQRRGTLTIPATATVIVITTTTGDVTISHGAEGTSGTWNDRLGNNVQQPTVTMEGDLARIAGDGRTDITISTGSEVEVRIETNTGDIDGRDLRQQRVALRTTTGDIDVEFEDAPAQVGINTTTGDVQLTVPRLPSPDGYAVTTQTNTGDVDVFASNGRRPIAVRTTTGDIEVQQR